MTTQADIETIQNNVLRYHNSANANAEAIAINAGIDTLANYKSGITQTSDAQHGTKPAIIVPAYINGVIDSSSLLDAHATFCRGQYASYVSLGSAQPELGPYEALGNGMSATTGFAALVSLKTNAQIWQDAYAWAIGGTMGGAQIAHFDAQYTYFYGLYTGAGIPAATADMQAKGAVVGQILGFGGTGGSSTIVSPKAETWLANAANGSPSYGGAL